MKRRFYTAMSGAVALSALIVTIAVAQVYPVRLDPQETTSAAPSPPSLVLADGGLEFPDGSVQTTAAAGGYAPVEDTGQQGWWNASGNPIGCSGTGQDGELQRGVDWPSPRFTDNDNGTVTDDLTGLIWLQDANCASFGAPIDFEDALAAANGLSQGICGLTDGSVATEIAAHQGTVELGGLRRVESSLAARPSVHERAVVVLLVVVVQRLRPVQRLVRIHGLRQQPREQQGRQRLCLAGPRRPVTGPGRRLYAA